MGANQALCRCCLTTSFGPVSTLCSLSGVQVLLQGPMFQLSALLATFTCIQGTGAGQTRKVTAGHSLSSVWESSVCALCVTMGPAQV